MPAVSTKRTGMPLSEAVSETVSRVVPGISVTIARSCSSRRLKRLLLPTFGRPTMASVNPSCTSFPYANLRASRSRPSSIGAEATQNLLVGGNVDIVFGEIDAGLQQRNQLEQLLFQRSDAARYGSLDLLCSDTRLVDRRGFDEIADSLGLRKIEAAVEIRAKRELAWFGKARSGEHGPFHAVTQHDGSAMTGDLDHVLGGVRPRRRDKMSQPPDPQLRPAHPRANPIAAVHGFQM